MRVIVNWQFKRFNSRLSVNKDNRNFDKKANKATERCYEATLEVTKEH